MSPPVFISLNVGGTAARLAAIRGAVRADASEFSMFTGRVCMVLHLCVCISLRATQTFVSHFNRVAAGNAVPGCTDLDPGLRRSTQVRASGFDGYDSGHKFVANATLIGFLRRPILVFLAKRHTRYKVYIGRSDTIINAAESYQTDLTAC